MMLFVYGILRRNQPASLEQMGQRFIGEAMLDDARKIAELCVIESAGSSVQGEVFEVDEELIPQLDALEGAYDRKVMTARLLGDPAPIDVNVYIWRGGYDVRDYSEASG